MLNLGHCYCLFELRLRVIENWDIFVLCTETFPSGSYDIFKQTKAEFEQLQKWESPEQQY